MSDFPTLLIQSNPLEIVESGVWCVYLILCEGGSLYCGISNRPAARFAAHLTGKGAKYTRLRKPLQMRLIYEDLSRQAASKLEARIKKLKVLEKQKLWINGREINISS
ncbi:MAG: GIY-YIG nuclease family protein [Neisseria sp.]|nr:GIY-YIG nuclease family protein [Neisseria sp.]MDO4641116.1 GIY-YIG nuclease family protein [Neisseria sp.]